MIPEQYTSLVGTKKIFSGALFTKKPIEPTEFEILDIRHSSAWITDLKSGKSFNAFELLVKNENLKRAKWTRPFKMEDVPLD